MRLSVNISTRGRPHNLKPTIERTLQNSVCDDTRILIAIDDDDQATLDALPTFPKHDKLIYSIKLREDNRGEKTDRLLTEAPADVYLVGHDSAPIITPGWDQMFIDGAASFPDGIGTLAGVMANSSFPALQAVTAKWVDIVGYIYNPAYPFWFVDHELDDLARMTGRLFFTFVECDIAPMRPGKTIRLRDLTFWMDHFDLGVYRRRAMARKIINQLSDPEWEKAMKRTWHDMVERRSESVHKGLRPVADQVEFGFTDKDGVFHDGRGEGGEPDPGYLQAFNRAREDMKHMRQETAELFRQINREAA